MFPLNLYISIYLASLNVFNCELVIDASEASFNFSRIVLLKSNVIEQLYPAVAEAELDSLVLVAV